MPKLKELLENVDYVIERNGNPEISAVCDDTRRVAPGSLFVCVKGLRFDPHEKIAEIAQKAAALIIEREDLDLSGVKIPVARVENAREALSLAAAASYKAAGRFPDIPVIGVTGTNGKTSTTYFIENILKAAGLKAGVIGTVGVKLAGEALDVKFDTSTTPDTLPLMEIFAELGERGADAIVIETSSHALALHKLRGLRFKAGVFTNLTQDHLDFHGDMENYFAAKRRLFADCEYAVINIDDEYGRRLVRGLAESESKILTYGLSEAADLRAVDPVCGSGEVVYDLKYIESFARIKVPVAGKFTVYNSLAAIASAFALNIPFKHIVAASAEMPQVAGRVESIPNTLGVNFIVDYAHTPDALEKLLESAADFTEGRVISVFGCGGDRDRGKRPIMGEIAGRLSGYCVITSDNPRSEPPEAIIGEIEAGLKKTGCPYEKQPDRRAAIETAVRMARKGDTVVVAGKGHENYQEFKDKTIHFDDAEAIREILNNPPGADKKG
ncbi:MAG: UDP-N-acetylmuramoyl-L-alanyl-D-glutamate--2,6-diaminopimelate ligase [Clostridiales bacterium]|nr:UDP-N-acetylmuramoyl-L-alanyl-D-glutamate--2,6-diaminopimelate ligase [Clostridiales bacterium]